MDAHKVYLHEQYNIVYKIKSQKHLNNKQRELIHLHDLITHLITHK